MEKAKKKTNDIEENNYSNETSYILSIIDNKEREVTNNFYIDWNFFIKFKISRNYFIRIL